MLVTPPVKVFLSYAHDDTYWCSALRKHLSGLQRDGKIEVWYDALICTGDDWKQKIDVILADMNLFVFLISAAFVDSDVCNEEFDTASSRQDHEEDVPLMGIRLRPVRVPEKISRLQWTPRGKPITSRRDRDEGLVEAVADIEKQVEELFSRRKTKRRSRRKTKI